MRFAAYEAESRRRTGIGGMFYISSYYTEFDSKRIETIDYAKGQAVNISIGFLSDGVTFSGFLEKAGRYLRAGLAIVFDL